MAITVLGIILNTTVILICYRTFPSGIARGSSIDDGGRSLSLFDWLLLPLLSLCNCIQRDSNGAQVVNNGAVQTTLIDEQPGDRSPSESMYTYYRPFGTVTDLSVASDFEVPIRSRSFDNSDSSSSDQLKITDLPLTALWAICGDLRPDNASKKPCKDLYNLRNTCRAFAYTVNSFFEKPANLPLIGNATLKFEDSMIKMYAYMHPINYVMHPLRDNRAIFQSENDSNLECEKYTSIRASFAVDNDEAIDLATQSLCGPIGFITISDFKTPCDLNKVFKFSRNFAIKLLQCTFNTIKNQIGSVILAYARMQRNLKIIINCNRSEISDITDFFNQLYSLTERGISVSLAHWRIRDPLFFGKSNVFWHQWVMQKLDDGCHFNYNISNKFTKDTDPTLDDANLWDLGWQSAKHY